MLRSVRTANQKQQVPLTFVLLHDRQVERVAHALWHAQLKELPVAVVADVDGVIVRLPAQQRGQLRAF